MKFLTKYQIREEFEKYLEGIPNNSRILFEENTESFHIGNEIEKIISKYQTFINIEKNKNISSIEQRDKEILQGNFSKPYKKDYRR